MGKWIVEWMNWWMHGCMGNEWLLQHTNYNKERGDVVGGHQIDGKFKKKTFYTKFCTRGITRAHTLRHVTLVLIM